jgi:hypothetical protein
MTTAPGRSDCTADRGREAVYAAEEAAFGGTTLGERRSLRELQGRASMIVDGDWWRQAGGPAVDVVAARSTARSSSARHDARHAAVVRLATGQLDEMTIAHELAHLLAGIDHGHDDRFRAALLDVVALLAGPRAASMLAHAYAAFGLTTGRRAWPPPVRGSGPTFVIVP